MIFKKCLFIAFLCFFQGCRISSYKPKLPENPQQIISLSPEATELLYALEQQHRLIGVSAQCNYPAETKNKHVVGTFSQPSLEEIVSLQPDLVIAAGIEQAQILTKLQRLGIPVIEYRPRTLDDLFTSVAALGSLLNANKQACKIISIVKNELNKSDNNTTAKRPKVYFEIADKPMMTINKNTFIHELITAAGGENVGANGIRPFFKVSIESIVNWNPDIIITGYPVSKEQILSRYGWQEITAVKNNNVITSIDPDLLLRAGPRISIGLQQLRAHINELRERDSYE